MTMQSNSKAGLDVSHLPTYAYGTKNPLWWGTQFFMLIEGLGFAFAVAIYLYLYNQNDNWPLGPQYKLLTPSILIGVFALSEIPNIWLKKMAKKGDVAKIRIGLIVMSAIGLLCLIIRALEINALNIVRWDANAYASITWFLVCLHTTHLITDVVETWAMTTAYIIGPLDMRRLPEVEDNQDYWHFIAGFGAIIYIVAYLVPRWFAVSP
jgi:cytochrome c oxidase subunit 3